MKSIKEIKADLLNNFLTEWKQNIPKFEVIDNKERITVKSKICTRYCGTFELDEVRTMLKEKYNENIN